MSTFTYRSWGGGARIVEADEVRFEPGYVVFWNRASNENNEYRSQRLVLAVRDVDCNDLAEAAP